MSKDQFYLEQGKEKFEKEDYKGAIEDFTKVIDDKDSDINNFVNSSRLRGDSKNILSDYQGAIDDYTVVLKIVPDYANAYSSRGECKQKISDYKGAIEDFTKAIQLEPDFFEPFVNRGICKGKLTDFKGALEDNNKAIELDPIWFGNFSNRADIKYKLKDFQGAIEDYSKAINLKSNFAWAYQERGAAKNEVGDYKGAIEDFNKVIEIDPEDDVAYCKRGKVKSKNKDHQGALEDFNRAIELNPNPWENYFSRGKVKNSLEDYNGAIEDYDTGIEKASEEKPGYSNSKLRKSIALNLITPKVIIEKLLKDEYRWVREAAAAHPFIKKNEINKLITVGDRYILKGLVVNPNCTKPDQDKINNLLEDKNKYPIEYDKYRLEFKGRVNLVEKIAGEVSIDTVVEAIVSEHRDWSEFVQNEFYAWDDLWHEYGTTDHVDSVIYPDGTSEMLTFDYKEEKSEFLIGNKNSGLPFFTHEAKSYENGSWKWKEFKLEYEFNSEYLHFYDDLDPGEYGLIKMYNYVNPEEEEDEVEIEGEAGDSYGKDVEITLYVNDGDIGLQEFYNSFDDVKKDMEIEGMAFKDKEAIKAFLIKIYNQ